MTRRPIPVPAGGVTRHRAPDPLTPAACDLGGEPFPHALLVRLMRETFGASEDEAIRTAQSIGLVRTAGGWVRGH